MQQTFLPVRYNIDAARPGIEVFDDFLTAWSDLEVFDCKIVISSARKNVCLSPHAMNVLLPSWIPVSFSDDKSPFNFIFWSLSPAKFNVKSTHILNIVIRLFHTVFPY